MKLISDLSFVSGHRTAWSVSANGNWLVQWWAQLLALVSMSWFPLNENKMGKGKLKKCLLISVMMCVTALSIAVVSLLRVLCERLLGHKGETIPRITVCAMLLFVHLFVAELPFLQRMNFLTKLYHLSRVLMWFLEACYRVLAIGYSVLLSSPFSR